MSKYTSTILQPIVAACKSYAEVCRQLGIKESTGAQSYLSKKIKVLGLDTSHFTGKAWNKGQTFDKKDAMQYCYKGSTISSHALKLKLIRDKYKEAKCESCSVTEWLGESIVLELDHKDSDHSNNEFTNLQVLCPNCHALFTRQRLSL